MNKIREKFINERKKDMLKKFFCKALVVLAIMITFTTLFSVSALAVEENTVMTAVLPKLVLIRISAEIYRFITILRVFLRRIFFLRGAVST